jgi:predicted transcriptional regulator of viral defense system
MTFDELLDTVADLPLFRGTLLLAGDHDPADVRRQLSRWKKAGKVHQLRRGVYVLARPWRQVEPHPFVVANELHHPSYVSLQSALAWHGLVPESVPVVTSVTTGRPVTLETELGRFVFRHVHERMFHGYRRLRVLGDGARPQTALVADPAKALLDLVHLTPGGDSREFVESLRLEGLAAVSESDLRTLADRQGRPKLDRAVRAILELRDRP